MQEREKEREKHRERERKNRERKRQIEREKETEREHALHLKLHLDHVLSLFGNCLSLRCCSCRLMCLPLRLLKLEFEGELVASKGGREEEKKRR